ncbi:MAG: PAS domain-containing protein [Bacteroidetes bacterium]|nr:PAS domain-containing protein [Bacteroidota bacterium]
MQRKTIFLTRGDQFIKLDRLKDIPAWCAGIAILSGLIALSGWCFNISAFKAFLSDGIPMTVNTAHLLILGGLCLALVNSEYVKAARVLLAISLLFALAIIFEHISGADLYIDQFVTPGHFSPGAVPAPDRTPLLIALYAALGSTAMLLSSHKRYYTAQFLSCTLIIFIYISLLGTVFQIFGLYQPGSAGPAFHTAATLLLLAAGTMLLRPDEGWIKPMYRRVARKDLLIYLTGYVFAAAPLFAAMYLFVIKNSTIAPASDMLVLFLLTIILSVPVVYFLSQLFNRLEEEVRGAHEQLRIAVQASGSGVWDLDVQQGILSHSAQFAQLVGRPDKLLVTPDALWSCFHEDDTVPARTAFEQAIRSGRLAFQARILTEIGNIRWLQFYGETQRDRYGITVRLLGTVMDITAQKKMDQQKDEFISVASHELKTPLTSLKSYVQLAHMKSNNLEGREISGMLERAETQINKMTRMIRDFLNAAQSDSGKMVLNREEFLLDDLIREIITDLSVNTRRKRLRFSDCPPLRVSADREKIEQVLANLIGNALKYSTGDEPVIISGTRTAGRVIISVNDQGIGINDKDKKHLFDRFYRSEDPNSRGVTGFGIGLYVSAEIIRLHGGDIGVDSEIGQGSRFWFDLPQVVPADTAEWQVLM